MILFSFVSSFYVFLWFFSSYYPSPSWSLSFSLLLSRQRFNERSLSLPSLVSFDRLGKFDTQSEREGNQGSKKVFKQTESSIAQEQRGGTFLLDQNEEAQGGALVTLDLGLPFLPSSPLTPSSFPHVFPSSSSSTLRGNHFYSPSLFESTSERAWDCAGRDGLDRVELRSSKLTLRSSRSPHRWIARGTARIKELVDVDTSVWNAE